MSWFATPMTDTTTSQADNSNQVTPADLAATTAADTATAQTVDTSAGADTQADATDAGKPETFDRDYVEQLRKEAASYRTKAKELEDQFTTTKTEKDDLIQQIGKALGLVDDQTDDPAKLLEAATKREQELAQERDDTARQLREYRQRDAIREASTTAKITDHALLEAVLKTNNAFNALDINADDYQAQVAQFITEAVQQHPALAQVAPTASGVDTSTTNSGAKGQLTREDLANMTSAEINQAAREGKLNHLMK